MKGHRTSDEPGPERTIARLRKLVRASELLNSSLDLGKILEVLLKYTTASLGASGGTIYLIDQARSELWARAMAGGKNVEIRLPIGQGIAGYVAATGKTVRIKDAYKDRRFFKGIDQETGFRTKSMICAPMKNRRGELIGVFQILNKRRGSFGADDQRFLRAISVPATIAIENSRLHRAELESQRIQRDLELASSLQRQILPSSLPPVPGVRIRALTRPCRSVGGDFYDVIEARDGVVIVAIADVSGKGIGAALLVSTFQAALHTYAEFGLSIEETVMKLNTIIYEGSTDESFVTCVLGEYNPITRAFRYVNAGHNYPVLLHENGTNQELSIGGLALGMLPDPRFEAGELVLETGDRLLLYTDGVTEAMNENGKMFGEERLLSILREYRNADAHTIVGELCAHIEAFSGSALQADDITLLLMSISDTHESTGTDS